MQTRSNLYSRLSVLAVIVGLLAAGRASAAQEAHAAAAAADARQEAHAPAAAGSHEAAGAEHGSSAEDSNPLKPEPTLAIWTFVVFVGLMFVLGRFAWKPLLVALHERERHMQHVLEETERRRATRARACWPSTAGRWPGPPTRCGPSSTRRGRTPRPRADS